LKESAKRGKRRGKSVEEKGEEESATLISVEDESNVEEKLWEVLGTDEENVSEREAFEEGPSEKGARTDASKHNRRKNKVAARVHVISRVMRVAFGVEDADVILRSRCTLDSLVRLNDPFDDFHRDATRGIIFRATLEYGGMQMNHHLTLVLVKCWVPWWKPFN